MRSVIIGLVFVAIMLAGGTAYLLRNYLSTQQAEIAAQAPKATTLKILVASNNMDLGTVVNGNNLEWVEWPEDGIQDSYLVESEEADPIKMFEKDKYIARRTYMKGEPITLARLYKATDPGFLRGTLAPGMRAVAIKTNAETAASGFILPGDQVDVLLTHSMISTALNSKGVSAKGNIKLGIKHTSETIMQKIRVLAVDQQINEFEGVALVGKTVLLEVTPKQAEMLHTAKAMGLISMVLRSAEEGTPDYGRHFSTDVEVSPVLSAFNVMFGGSPTNTKAPPRKAAPVTVKKSPVYVSKKKITVYSGTSGPSKQSADGASEGTDQ